MSWWGRAVAAGVLFIAFLGRSGGGFGHSSVCGSLNDLYVAGTWATLLAVPLFLLLGVLSIVSRLFQKVGPAVDTPPPGYSDAPAAEASLRRSFVARMLPGAIVLAIAVFVLAGPSGCVPFNVCAQGGEVARAPGQGVRFERVEAPQEVASEQSSFTATFEATAPWSLHWNSTADGARLDVFTADAMQQGRYFPSLGHPAYADDGPSGSTIVDTTGTFCVRIALRDLAFESARNSYYAETRHSAPPPSSRSMSWEIAITSP